MPNVIIWKNLNNLLRFAGPSGSRWSSSLRESSRGCLLCCSSCPMLSLLSAIFLVAKPKNLILSVLVPSCEKFFCDNLCNLWEPFTVVFVVPCCLCCLHCNLLKNCWRNILLFGEKAVTLWVNKQLYEFNPFHNRHYSVWVPVRHICHRRLRSQLWTS